MFLTKQEVWLSQTAPWDLVHIHLEVEHPERGMTDLTVSPHPFDRWLRQHLLELHGQDLEQLASAHELIFA